MRAPAHRTAILVDQHPLWLDTLEHAVRRIGIDVLGKSTSSSEAAALLDRQSPNLLICGVGMPAGELDGIALVAAARLRHPLLKAIVLSGNDDPSEVARAFAAGTDAYLLKRAHADDLTTAIRQAFDPTLFLAVPSVAPATAAAGQPASQPGLTPRELEILRLAAEGHSNAELARRLWVTEQTVKFHLSNVYRKLEVSNRTEASRWAQLQGLLDGTDLTVEAVA